MCNMLMSKLRRKLPELASVKDLLRIGLYRTEQAAYAARKRGKCPPYFRIPSRGIVYPKDGIIEFLEKHASNLNEELKIRNAIISNSEVPPLRQNEKDMSR